MIIFHGNKRAAIKRQINVLAMRFALNSAKAWDSRVAEVSPLEQSLGQTAANWSSSLALTGNGA